MVTIFDVCALKPNLSFLIALTVLHWSLSEMVSTAQQYNTTCTWYIENSEQISKSIKSYRALSTTSCSKSSSSATAFNTTNRRRGTTLSSAEFSRYDAYTPLCVFLSKISPALWQVLNISSTMWGCPPGKTWQSSLTTWQLRFPTAVFQTHCHELSPKYP